MLTTLVLLIFASTANAEVPQVVTTIRPLHALTAKLMEGIGEPELLIETSQGDPHHFTLRPSSARKLAQADIILWIGRELEGPLARFLGTLSEPRIVSAIDIPDMRILTQRRRGIIQAEGEHDYGHEAEYGDEHSHHGERGHRGGHEGHGKYKGCHEGHENHRHEEHEDEHSHGHEGRHHEYKGHHEGHENHRHEEHEDEHSHGHEGRHHEYKGHHEGHESCHHGEHGDGHGHEGHGKYKGRHEGHENHHHGEHGDGHGHEGHGKYKGRHEGHENHHHGEHGDGHGHEGHGKYKGRHEGHENHHHGEHEDEHEDEHGHHESHLRDPHIWLDLDNAAKIVEVMTAHLIDLDPDNAEAYRRNRESLLQDLTTLDQTTRQKLRTVQERSYIIFHDSIQYFERRYGLRFMGALTTAHGEPVSAKVLRESQQALGGSGCVVYQYPEPPSAFFEIMGQNVTVGVVDLLGLTLEPGRSLYFEMIDQIADEMSRCLEGM